MSRDRSKVEFSLPRCLAVSVLFAASGVAIVVQLRPEERLDDSEIAALVEVRVVPRLAPTEESIRRGALSQDALRAVRTELSQGTEDADEVIRSWRRCLSVEVREVDRDRRHIRFIWAGAGNRPEAAKIVQTVAMRFAGDLAARRWYDAVDRLRTAVELNLKASEDLIRFTGDAVRPGDAGPPQSAASRSAHAGLDAVEAEVERLTRLREAMLLSLQPAHPEVAALDQRLTQLRTLALGAPIRRLSNETAEPVFGDYRRSVAPPTPMSHLEAQVNLRRTQADVEQCLVEILSPSAAEFPVVTVSPVASLPWNTRNFWYVSACLPGLVPAVIAGRRVRTTETAAESLPRSVAEVAASPTAVSIDAPPSSEAQGIEVEHPVIAARASARIDAATSGPALLAPVRRRRDRSIVNHGVS